MQVVSVRIPYFSQHYLVAMATSLEKSENEVQIDYQHPKGFHMVKTVQKLVQYIRRYSTKYASFFAMSYQKFTNELCQLRTYWTKVHEIEASFTLLMRALR